MQGKQQEIAERINQVLWGKSIVDVLDGSGLARTFVLRSLTAAENNILDFVYNREFADAVRSGMKPEEDLLAMYEAQGIWSEYDETCIKGFKKKIDILGEQRKQYEFQKSKRRRIERQIESTRNELAATESHRANLMMLSAENRAEEVKRRMLIRFSALNQSDLTPYWDSDDAFMNEDDSVLIFNLALAYYRNNVLTLPETREVARSPQWRFRWLAAKKGGADLFGCPVPDWSEAQAAVVYWSQYYDFVFESPDRPSQFVIDDDAAIDSWYEEQVAKMQPKGDEKKNIVGTKKAKTNKFHQEQFVFVERGDTETVKKIQEMNSASTRARLRSEQDKIREAAKDGKRVKEWDLRKREYLVGSMKEFTKVTQTGPGKGKA